jgi:hypothetical protein
VTVKEKYLLSAKCVKQLLVLYSPHLGRMEKSALRDFKNRCLELAAREPRRVK